MQANVLQTNQPPRASKCSSNKPATPCKQMFFKQTSHPVQANVLQTNQPPRASKCSSNKPATPKEKAATLPEEQQQPPKQTKSSNCNEIPTRESKTVSNKTTTSNQKHNPRKGNSTVLVRTQRETKRDEGEKERRRARQQARDPREMRERERTRRRLREREGRASTQLVKLRESELKAARNRKRA